MVSKMDKIPTPPRQPFVGNLLQIPKSRMAQHFLEVSRQFDGIFDIDFAGFRATFVSSAELVAELTDERRFRKVVRPPLSLLRRNMVGDGLFTAHSDEEPWGKAHRILMPAFSQRAMKSYFDAMLEVAEQLSANWEQKQGRDILVADDMTRLTLDTISLAGFGYRFDSFRNEELHPFLGAMVRVLDATMSKLTQLPMLSRWRKDSAEYVADIERMNELVDEVIRARREQPVAGSDLLNLMLNAEDPETGKRLDDLNIRHQVLTFLVAGHETTSGLLTFAIYFLLRNPQVLAQAYAEVDRVLPGDTGPEYRHLAQLPVIERVLKETLRLWPTAPAFMVAPYEDTVIGGRYRIPKDQGVSISLLGLHRDPVVWDDPETFDIDRFLPENEAKLHPHAYKPFGNGERACIGRQFALTEAKLALALILQRFALSDPHDYQLHIRETLTLKPDHLYIRARRRRPQERLVTTATDSAVSQTDTGPDLSAVNGDGEPFIAAYGSSLGTARDIASQMAARASSAGFNASCVTLDSLVDNLPKTGVLAIVTATYNGYAPDSALTFEERIVANAFAQTQRPDLRYAVLGCGNTQWRTYQAFPQKVEQVLAGTGARAIIKRGKADGNADFEGMAEAWLDGFWQTLGEATGGDEIPAAVSVRFLDEQATRTDVLPEGACRLQVISNNELARDPTGLWDFSLEAPLASARHLALELPQGMTYQTGDHLAVYPSNRKELVARAADALGVSIADTLILSRSSGSAPLPVGKVLSVGQLLTDFLELQDPASRRDLRILAAHSPCPHTRAQLETSLADDEESRARFRSEVTAKRQSVIDLLEQFPAIRLPFEVFVGLCPPLRPRFYSISSSPLQTPHQLTLTVRTVSGPAWSGFGLYRGVASNFLRFLEPGATLLGFIRTPSPTFAPPEDLKTQMILVGPGTGIAPFRGFLQERAQQAATDLNAPRSLLFSGCRHPEHDAFYAEELQAWQAQGIVDIRPAFSCVEEQAHRYVQDALWASRQEVWSALEAGAILYVCGDAARMAPAVRDCLISIHQDQRNSSQEEASAWPEVMMREGRYRQDVFGPA